MAWIVFPYNAGACDLSIKYFDYEAYYGPVKIALLPYDRTVLSKFGAEGKDWKVIKTVSADQIQPVSDVGVAVPLTDSELKSLKPLINSNDVCIIDDLQKLTAGDDDILGWYEYYEIERYDRDVHIHTKYQQYAVVRLNALKVLIETWDSEEQRSGRENGTGWVRTVSTRSVNVYYLPLHLKDQIPTGVDYWECEEYDRCDCEGKVNEAMQQLGEVLRKSPYSMGVSYSEDVLEDHGKYDTYVYITIEINHYL